MAAEEARALLDSLMGGDRNAPLPPGAAVPTRKRQRGNNNGSGDQQGMLLLPGKRHKSCYDKDIDPLYTAWGVDVYDLFVNTKSDLGTNPYVVDPAAHEEFLKLSPQQQDALGYHYFLFQKLQELVRQCDRAVTRNKEKLAAELQRKLQQRGGTDFVVTVDDAAVEMLARTKVQVEWLLLDLEQQTDQLRDLVEKEVDLKRKLEPLLKEQQHKLKEQQDEEKYKAATPQPKQEETEAAENCKEKENANGAPEMKIAESHDTLALKQEQVPDSTAVPEPDKDIKIETEPDEETELQQEQPKETSSDSTSELTKTANKTDTSKDQLQSLQMELGRLTLEKQRLLHRTANTVARVAPLQESVETQHRNLCHVKSDISTDKAVCEVSGNFMSARDADERIAAHYAGKQYVGWKLVREKLAAMIAKYGRYGPHPPAPGRGGAGPDVAGGGPPMRGPPHGGGGGGRGAGRSGGYGGGGFDRGGRGRGRYDSGAGGGGYYRGGSGGAGGDRGGGAGGRWERNAAGAGGGGNHAYQQGGRRGSGGPPSRNIGSWRR